MKILQSNLKNSTNVVMLVLFVKEIDISQLCNVTYLDVISLDG